MAGVAEAQTLGNRLYGQCRMEQRILRFFDPPAHGELLRRHLIALPEALHEIRQAEPTHISKLRVGDFPRHMRIDVGFYQLKVCPPSVRCLSKRRHLVVLQHRYQQPIDLYGWLIKRVHHQPLLNHTDLGANIRINRTGPDRAAAIKQMPDDLIGITAIDFQPDFPHGVCRITPIFMRHMRGQQHQLIAVQLIAFVFKLQISVTG